MVAVTLMWSIAGVVTRQLEAARSFEVTFWRSAFTVVVLLGFLAWLRTPRGLWQAIRDGGWRLWLSGVCWSVMFTAFMLALTLTSVANVLVTLATGPLLTALTARLALGHRLPRRTWIAILVAGLGIAWMYARDFAGGDARELLGVAVAACVPVAAAINWTVLQSHRTAGARQAASDPLPALLLGGLISSLATLPLALPFQASAHDLGLLGLLGVVQLALPCLLVIQAARVLSAPEVALLSLLEVIFGVLWVWLVSGEAPTSAVLVGGALVIIALAGNEVLNLRSTRSLARP